MPRSVAVVVKQKKNPTEVSDQLQKRKPRATLQSAQTSLSFVQPTKDESDLLNGGGKRSDCYMNVVLHKHKSGIMMLAIRPTTNEPIAAWRDQKFICPIKSSYAHASCFKHIAFNKLRAKIVYSNTIQSLLPLPDNVELQPYGDEICMLTAIRQLLSCKNTPKQNPKRSILSLAELQSLDPSITRKDYEKIYNTVRS